MIPSVMQGWGGQLYLLRGGQIDIVNKSLEAQADPSITTTVGQTRQDGADVGDFYRALWGGQNSYIPGAYANHKPMAFSPRGRLYQALHLLHEANLNLYIGGWDGSGLFFHRGGDFEAQLWKSGRGWDAASPSGSHSVRSYDHALIRHNNFVFGIGVHKESDPSGPSSNWTQKMGWTFDFSTISELSPADITRRTYRVFSISDQDKKIMGPVTRFLPNALTFEHLNACDAFAFRDDLYYANWVDILKFPGASGTPEVLHFDRNNPRARSFGAWPSGGIDSDGTAIGENRLLVLDSDGSLYRLNTTASGRNLLVDLTDLRTNEAGRPNDNFFSRTQSSTNEPGRSPLLLAQNRELHAFVVSASSGYLHFTCNGDPSGTTNWTDRTDQLPPNFKNKDGNVYGFADTIRNKLYLLHCTYSSFGVYGAEGGGQDCGGGFWLYQHDFNRDWLEVTRNIIGMPPRGLVPYQNLGPYVGVPSGNNPEVFKCSDYAIMTYNLYDSLARAVNVDVEFSLDVGVSWNTARRFRAYTGPFMGSGVQNLATSPDGIQYTFFWDYVNDIGFNNQEEVLLRVRPKLVR
jgi:hypothetical protein